MASSSSFRIAFLSQFVVTFIVSMIATNCNDSTPEATKFPVDNTNPLGAGGASLTLPSGLGGGTSGATLAGGFTSIAANRATVIAPPDGVCHFPASYDGTGSLTWYLFSQGSSEVNCSYAITGRDPDQVEFVTTGGGQYFAAMNSADYNAAAMCGACVEVMRDGATTVVATVVDQCPTATNPKCQAGHLDLSQAAFLQLGTMSEGYLGSGNGARVGVVSWRYVPCASVGNVSIRLKEPKNKYWNEFLVENHRTPIVSFEAMISGAYMAGVRQSYNYFKVNGGKIAFPLQVRITDVNGAAIEAEIPFPANGEARIDLGQQFPLCVQ
jgi:expansin (peptidoglycan-binding protein)